MASKPRRQHIITKSFIKQWADDSGYVGVVCLYHRASVEVSYKGLHYIGNLSSPEQDALWGEDIEDPAIQIINDLRTMLDDDDDHLTAAEAHLSEPEHLSALVDFVALHHARSFVVPLTQAMVSDVPPGSAASGTTIEQRMQDAKGRYADCGLGLNLYTADTPMVLGAVPVFDALDWGERPPGTASFMMPLTPRAMLMGVPELPSGRVGAALGINDFEDRLSWQIAGSPGLFGTPYLICEPSALDRVSEAALRLSEGSAWHWVAISDRIALCEDIPPDLRADWQQRLSRHERLQGTCADPTTTQSMKNKHHRTLAKDARKVQADLDELDVRACDCSKYRRDQERSSIWRAAMPQLICQGASPTAPKVCVRPRSRACSNTSKTDH